jgi:3-hydroxyisobutyrate dehydrogenase
MGFAIAQRLARSGFRVLAWNRSRAKAEPLSPDAAVVDSPAEAAAGADVLLTILTNAHAALESITAAVPEFPRDRTAWLQMSTVGEDGTDRCLETARELGLPFVDAPVTGTRTGAEAGELVMLASGPDDARAYVEPVFEAIGRTTVWAGAAGAGTRMKLAANARLLAVAESTAESLAFADGIGLDPNQLLDVVRGGAADPDYLQTRGREMLERDFTPKFKLALAAKDAALVDESADRHELDLPLFRAVRASFEAGVPAHGDEDMIATYLTTARSVASS